MPDGLDTSRPAYLGRPLVCRPRHGRGGHRYPDGRPHRHAPLDYAPVDAAGPFRLDVHRLSFEDVGRPRGLVGCVEQPGHRFDGLWVVAWTMLVGTDDFTDHPCHRWDIEMGTDEPSGADRPTVPDGSCAYGGHGVRAAEGAPVGSLAPSSA